MSDELQKLAKKIRVFFCDGDGVLFTGSVLMGAPYKAKWRSHNDGQGLSLLRAAGIRIVFITNERGDGAAALREMTDKLNSLPSSVPQKADGFPPVVFFEGYGGLRKLEAAEQFLKENGMSLSESAFMGDDVVDAPLLKAVALPASPITGEDSVKRLAKFISTRPGGAGAIRDFANMILEAHDIDPLSLPLQ